MRCSIDSNIALYAFADHRDTRKTRISRNIIGAFVDSSECTISTQVLNEFANVCTRRLRPTLSEAEVLEYLAELSRFDIAIIDTRMATAAVRRHFADKISYYDSLIVEAAVRSGAEVLYTEDMHHGMRYGALHIVNPFL